MGGRFHPRLNINTRPIANKYHEGKVKRTLKRGLKVHETVMGEANAAVVFVHEGLAFRSRKVSPFVYKQRQLLSRV